MAVLSIEDTTIDNGHVTVTAMVDNMRLLYRATHLDPEEWAPALCQTTFELCEDESIPTTEDGFCCYLDQLEPQWQLVDTSDWNYES